ncbi:MAG: HEPN domain-containing protein [Desulforhabdus sp.]|nr:HEPN domain-containing protein [Desulforhabdus sp.]
MANRALDWLRQAERDIEQAADSERLGRHEWACFAAQQAAEKPVKVLHLHLRQEAWGHVIAKLLRELPDEVIIPPELIDKARILDSYHILRRHPSGHPGTLRRVAERRGYPLCQGDH